MHCKLMYKPLRVNLSYYSGDVPGCRLSDRGLGRHIIVYQEIYRVRHQNPDKKQLLLAKMPKLYETFSWNTTTDVL